MTRPPFSASQLTVWQRLRQKYHHCGKLPERRLESSNISIRRNNLGAVSASNSALVDGIIETSAASLVKPAASNASFTSPKVSGVV